MGGCPYRRPVRSYHYRFRVGCGGWGVRAAGRQRAILAQAQLGVRAPPARSRMRRALQRLAAVILANVLAASLGGDAGVERSLGLATSTAAGVR